MFGDPFQIRYLDNFFKLFDFFGKVLHTDISDCIPCLFVFFGLALVLRARAFTNPCPDLPYFPFDSEDVVSILFRLSKGKLGRSVKGLVTAMTLKIKARSKNTKKQGMPSEMSS